MDIKEIHAFDNYEPSLAAFKKDIETELNIPVTIESTKQAAVEKAAAEVPAQ